jgi:hypothetical protein
MAQTNAKTLFFIHNSAKFNPWPKMLHTMKNDSSCRNIEVQDASLELFRPGGVAQWSLRVRIPPGAKFFGCVHCNAV